MPDRRDAHLPVKYGCRSLQLPATSDLEPRKLVQRLLALFSLDLPILRRLKQMLVTYNGIILLIMKERFIFVNIILDNHNIIIYDFRDYIVTHNIFLY